MNEKENEMVARFLSDPYAPELQFRVHGNGFIQIDLAPDTRLHFWSDLIPRQKVDTQIHDHRFSFKSYVLAGELVQTAYNIRANSATGRFQVYEAVPQSGENTELVAVEGFRCDVRAKYPSGLLVAGESYVFDALEFHRTDYLTPSVTLMVKTRITDHRPRVLCRVEQTPDNEFSRENWVDDPLVESAYKMGIQLLEQSLEQSVAG